MSTMREQFETWQSKQGRALRLAKEDSGKYCSSDVQSDWDVWQAATEAAKAESQDDNKPAMYCVPDKDGKPLFGKGWMFSPIPHLAATMPLYTRPAAKATGTAGEPEYCPACHGSGESAVMDGAGPYAAEVPCNCPHCNGTGALIDAYNGVVKLLAEENRKYLELRGKQWAAARQPAPVVEQVDLEAVAEAIFKVMKDSNMTDKDWKNGAILGFENSFRDQIKAAAKAAVAATNRSQP